MYFYWFVDTPNKYWRCDFIDNPVKSKNRIFFKSYVLIGPFRTASGCFNTCGKLLPGQVVKADGTREAKWQVKNKYVSQIKWGCNGRNT